MFNQPLAIGKTSYPTFWQLDFFNKPFNNLWQKTKCISGSLLFLCFIAALRELQQASETRTLLAEAMLISSQKTKFIHAHTDHILYWALQHLIRCGNRIHWSVAPQTPPHPFSRWDYTAPCS